MKKPGEEQTERNGSGPKKRKQPRVCGCDAYGLHPDNRLWGQVLKELRLARPCLLTDLATATGLRWQAIRKIEDGGCRPRLESVLKICEALEFPLVVVALVVELRREGVVVSIARVLRLRRRQRRALLKIADLAVATKAGR